jgi:hypothetical protein
VAYGIGRKSGNVKIVGIALDNPTIAEYMTRIESSPKYVGVKLLSINQNTSVKGLELKKFNINFKKLTPKNNLKRYRGNEKGKAFSIEKVNPIFDKLEKLSKIQRIAIWAGLLILLIGAFVYFSYLPKFKTIDKLKTNLNKN